MKLSTEDRFWAKVAIAGPSECWEWKTGKDKGEYGQFWLEGRRRIYAHRWAYEQAKGPIPEGLTIDHLCRNRACVNPNHLEAVTFKENIYRGNGITAMNRRKTHCKHGHEFTPENTYYRSNGVHRDCRTCQRRADAAYRQLKKKLQQRS